MKTKIKILAAAFLLFFASSLGNFAFAYETGIHYYLTYILANVCGLGAAGETIALADYSVDLFHDTDAGSHFDEWLDPTKEGTRRIFHFAVAPGTDQKVVRGSSWAWQSISIANDEASASNPNPITLGIGIHTLQDSYAHEGFTPMLGHWTKAPDLPVNDVPKLLEAAESTWVALDSWSLKVNGHGCTTPFADISERVKTWASLDLQSDSQIQTVWNGIAETIAGKKITLGDVNKTPEFQTAFEQTAAHIRSLKN